MPDLRTPHAGPAAHSRSATRSRAITGGLLVVLVGVFTLRALAHWPDEVDDVYIDALHARNLVEHGEIRLAASQGPVEGFSSPLNVGLHALAYAAHLPAVIAWAKARALVAAIGSILLTYFLLRRLESGRAIACAGAAALALSASFQYWAVAGLETPIYALLLLLAVYGLVERPQRAWSAVPLGLLAITRPEGAVFTLAACVFLALRAARERELTRELALRGARWLGSIVLIAGPYFVFRWLYFRELLPNTYFAKINDYSSWDAGIVYIGSFLRDQAPYAWLAIPFAFLPSKDPRHARLLVALFLAAELVVILRAGGDWMPRHRLMTQLQPLFVVLTGLVARDLLAGWSRRRAAQHEPTTSSATQHEPATPSAAPHEPATPSAAQHEPRTSSSKRGPARVLAPALRFATGVLVLILLARGEVRSADRLTRQDTVSEERVRTDAADYRAAAEWIRAESVQRGWAPEQVTVALEPVGIIPYDTRCDVIDLSGKTSREIARAVRRFGPEHHLDKDRFVADLVFRRRPEFFCRSGGMHPSHQEATMADPRFALEYERLGARGRVELFVRREPPREPNGVELMSSDNGLRRIGGASDPSGVEPTRSARVSSDDSVTSHGLSPHDVTPHDATPHDATPHGVTPHDVTQHDMTQPDARQRDATPNDSSVRQAVQTAIDAAQPVTVHAAIGGSAAWFDELGDLGRLEVRDQNPYFATLALTRDGAAPASLFAGLDLGRASSDATLLASVFSDGSVPWRFERAGEPHIVLTCAGPGTFHLLLLQPIALASRGVCLAWVECRAEKRRGSASGLFWGTFRERPSRAESIVEGGSALLPDGMGEWCTLSATIPVQPDAKFLSIGVGGRDNEGSQIWVRDIRVVRIPEPER